MHITDALLLLTTRVHPEMLKKLQFAQTRNITGSDKDDGDGDGDDVACEDDNEGDGVAEKVTKLT